MNREDVILEIRERYRQAGRTFNEFERRNWAAMEAMKLGWGGVTLVSQALRISPNTIKKGIAEIESGEANSYSPSNGRIRKSGGGRKSTKEPVMGPSRDTSEIDSTDSDAPVSSDLK